jgi:small conductance mechanosensitive channel
MILLSAHIWMELSMDLTNIDFAALRQSIVAFLPRLGLALLVLLVAWLLSRWASRMLKNRLDRQKADPEMITLLQMVTRWGILVLGIVLALEQIAPGRLNTLLAGVGILGVTVGFALQDVAKNFVAGILLLVTQPFELGDTIMVSDYTGTVTAINLRSTELREVDGRFVIIPNADIFVSSIINYTRSIERRVDLKLTVTPDTDLQKAVATGLSALEGVAGIMNDPGPVLFFDSFGDSTINGFLRYWVDTAQANLLETQHNILRKVQKAYEDEGIVMPYPTMEVSLINQE